MKQFLYLDTDIVNSILAQTNKGLILSQSEEQEEGADYSKSNESALDGNAEAGGSLLKLAKAEASISGKVSHISEKSEHENSKRIISITLHDAAFDLAYESIKSLIAKNDPSKDEYGQYVELDKPFEIVDFEYLESLFPDGALMSFMKTKENKELEQQARTDFEQQNRNNRRNNQSQFKKYLNEIISQNNTKYDEIKDIIKVIRQLVPYSRMLVSNDGYIVPLEDSYFRIDPHNMGFKYGGDLKVVGLITNIIGESTDPCDQDNLFATLHFQINEALRSILPTMENDLAVVHPIAIYYGN